MKLLVVDDSATRRRIVVNSLQHIGFTDVVEARGGREALERFDASVGLVITDRDLPDPGVPGLARELRARLDGRMVPILMVTTRSAREDLLAATDAGELLLHFLGRDLVFVDVFLDHGGAALLKVALGVVARLAPVGAVNVGVEASRGRFRGGRDSFPGAEI